MSEDRVREMWDDQQAFNKLLRQPPTTPEEMARMAKDFVLYTESELHELLSLFKWKAHRRGDHFDNPAHRFEELADAFKCLISLMQYCGMTYDDFVDYYWRKTAVVKQRYQEEWLGNLDRPCAIVDIDHVLCDYVTGLCNWLEGHTDLERDLIDEVRTKTRWIDHSTFPVSREKWEAIKHRFRVSGAKSSLPIFPDALPFLKSLKSRNLQIVLLTSRPIDRYPNMYTDTLDWLKKNELPFDYVWWAIDKADRVVEAEIRHHARIVIDDDMKYISQYERAGMHSYWIKRGCVPSAVPESPLVHPVASLREVVDHYDQTIRTKEAEQW
jgi:hypothetical protein